MKKRILIFSIAVVTLSLMAFSFIHSNDLAADGLETKSSKTIASFEKISDSIYGPYYPDFFLNVGIRFTDYKKEDLDKARSIHDLLPELKTQPIVSFKSVKVVILDDKTQTDIREIGNSEDLTDAQINLLRRSNYSTNVLIRADYNKKNMETGKLVDRYSRLFLTIVPEKQATYVDGKKALIEYLKTQSRTKTALVPENQLRPGKLFFTVTKKGTISNIKLGDTSGNIAIDNLMIDLISNAPGVWEPAENSKGEKVDQTFVFSFGRMGC